MLIGIDGNEANIDKRVGANVFAFEVLTHMYQQIQDQDTIKCRIYLKKPPLNDFPKPCPQWSYTTFGPQPLWTQWRLPLKLFSEKVRSDSPAIFFTPGHYAPRLSPIPTVITIMDLAFLHFKDEFRKKDLQQLTQWTKYSVAEAVHIFAISEATKTDIMKYYHIPSEKISVVYPGITLKIPKTPEDDSYQHISAYDGFKSPYLLFLGTLQPRKNILRLIEAFRQIKNQPEYKAYKLIIAGKKGWLYDEIYNRVNQLSLQDEVVFTGFVSEYEKIELLKHAQALVLPSLYEGFGIPVAESMALGTPVVVSQVSSLPEVAGSAGEYIKDPTSVTEIALSIAKVLQLSGKQREERISLGKAQVKQFTWEKCSQTIISTLTNLCKPTL